MFITKLSKHTKYTSRIFLRKSEIEKYFKEGDEFLVEVEENKIILKKINKKE